jgi:hypothetical protein
MTTLTPRNSHPRQVGPFFTSRHHYLDPPVAADDYAFVNTGGKRSKESSAAFIRRPKQPLIIYEFQVWHMVNHDEPVSIGSCI